jgi:hypothetical protein
MVRSLYVRSMGLAAIVAAVLAWSGVAEAACYAGAQQLRPQQIADFNGNPGQLLSQNPEGGGEMVSKVRDLAASDPATLSGIMGLLAKSNTDQKRAIGSGLAQAARVCVSSDQDYANKIQQAIADSKDQDLVVAYAAASGNLPIGAGGGGAGSSGSSGGATGVGTGIGAGAGIAEGIGGNGVNTPVFGITSSISSATNPNNNNGSTTISTSVSP